MNKSYRKMLVTGGAGFIGSEFVRQAVDKDYDIVVIDKLTYASSLKRLEAVKGRYKFYKQDICSKKALDKIFTKEKPDAIINFAAETHVDRSILDSQIFLKTNILGTHALLEAARLQKIAKFVHISTDEVYGDVAKGSSSEESPFLPNSPYSVSKAAADQLVTAYARTYKLPVNIVRPSNNYGPWQYPEKLIPVIIYKALNNQPVPVYAKGLNIREWLFVSDCAKGIMAVLEKGESGEAYNLSSGQSCPNIDVVKAVLKILGKPKDLIRFVKDRPGHDFRYSISSAKAKQELDYKSEYSFEHGIVETVKWYKDNQNWLNCKVKHLKEYWSKVYE
jgi:dTDP-glucose 4,6-dehydratase